MMASKVLSRFLPGVESISENHDRRYSERERMLESGVDSGRDQFHDFDDEQELDDMLVEAPQRKHGRGEPNQLQRQARDPRGRQDQHTRLPTSSAVRSPSPERYNDVPASLMMEAGRAGDESPDMRFKPEPVQQGPNKIRQQWTQAQQQQQLFHDSPEPPPLAFARQTQPVRQARLDRKERALWMWANVQDVDAFLQEVYQYYKDHGIWSILLSRVVYALSTAFLFATYMFLSTCIDYSKVPSSKTTGEILIPKCMAKTSFFKNVLLWVFVFWWPWFVFQTIMEVKHLRELHDFYHYLLGIPDSDIQTIAWEKVVESLMSLRNVNPETADNVPRYVRQLSKTTQSKQRMDAHDIANRLMRKDNYYIALINKEILDLQLHLPLAGSRHFYSKSLESCISQFCLENFVYDSYGYVAPHMLDPKRRLEMIELLRSRFRFAAVLSILMAPFNITAQCVLFFNRYYAEFRNSPSQLGARAFTPLAEWKMRDFNELDHDFQRRLKMAYPFADKYLAQFPRDKTIQFLRLVCLLTGTVAAVLGIATLLDPELFLGFEITHGRTAFFYLSVSMGVYAAARNAIPDDSEVHEPVLHLFEVIEYTHYAPQRWRNNFHTPAVRAEFSALYQMKVLIFLDEILSLVAAPFILWRNSGKPSAAIIDFFRQNTVHVDGLGGLCNHAVFEFRKRNKPEDDDAADPAHDLRDEYFGVKDQKMAQSQYYFMQRLGRYEGRQTQADRYQRTSAATAAAMHHHHHLPPVFPPLSPLREAARPRRKPSGSSPRQSALLDRAAPQPQPQQRRRGGPRRELELPRAEADLTTSKLIEADHSLADSWKFDPDEDEEGMEQREEERRRDAGVVGMLVEYTRAQGGKGGRIA